MGEWPVQDAVADLVINIFAPKNFAEAARVLRLGGGLAVAYPRSNHLIELHDRLGLMRQHGDKTQRYAEAMLRTLGPPTTARLCYRTILDAAAVRDVVLMGPNARHIAHR
jgi:23S rRNA (guanine745-N1)-methyltransferase